MTMTEISVARIAAIEETIGAAIGTINLGSIRKISQIYCDMHDISYADIADTNPATVIAWFHDFRACLAPAENTHDALPKIEITLDTLIKIEDALGAIYGGIDYDRVANQIVICQIIYGLDDKSLQNLRSMAYPAYLRDVWMPVSAALIAVLAPPPESTPKNP